MIKSPIVESLIECVCPSPRRYVQRLVRLHGLKDGLDIGCGESSLLTPLRSQGFRSAGIDGSPEMLASARERNLHDDYILADFRTHKFDRPFDVVVLSHVIEHFTRDEGLEALRRIEGLARHLVYVETPHGFLEQHALRGNPYMRHFSGWFTHDFESRGYSVFGSGVRGLKYSFFAGNSLWAALVNAADRSTRRLVYHCPSWANTISAIRYIDGEGNWRRV